MLPENVQQKLDALPVQPGVYVFFDKKGAVLYVGKARSLRSRVRSYFQAGRSDQRFFIDSLPHEIGNLETYVVANEKEAALLENSLIKEKKPRYNFKLRDDKEYLSIRLDVRDPWPRLTVVRRPRTDGAKYFGPYDSATAARKTLRLVNRHFQLRTCKDSDFAQRVRPCLQYQIKRCPGPCVMPVERTEYIAQAELVGLFLDGRQEELSHSLETRMKEAARTLEFERASVYRDQLRAISRVQEEQRVATARDIDQDVVGLYVEGDLAQLAMIDVRNGRMTNVRTFDFAAHLPDDELVASFVTAYYGGDVHLPNEVLLPLEVEAAEGLAAVLTERAGRKIEVLVPQRGARKDLVRMASENAQHAFREKQRAQDDVDGRLLEVQKRLRLPRLPRRIECVDISHTGGNDTVAAFTALYDGQPDRKRYKSFHLRTVSGGDDFAAMREVIGRRLARAKEPGWELPDLLVVDGGKGQLNVALGVLHDLGLRDQPICGLAKEKENVRGEMVSERVFLPGQKNGIALRERSATKHFLGMVRDEAHRVSNGLRKKLGKRRRLRSGLDDVPGVGPKTRSTLLRTLGSLRAIIHASVEELVAAGASQTQAAAVFSHFAPVRRAVTVDADGEMWIDEEAAAASENVDVDGAPASRGVDGAPASRDVDGAPASDDVDGAPASRGVDGAPASRDVDGAPASREAAGVAATSVDDEPSPSSGLDVATSEAEVTGRAPSGSTASSVHAEASSGSASSSGVAAEDVRDVAEESALDSAFDGAAPETPSSSGGRASPAPAVRELTDLDVDVEEVDLTRDHDA